MSDTVAVSKIVVADVGAEGMLDSVDERRQLVLRPRTGGDVQRRDLSIPGQGELVVTEGAGRRRRLCDRKGAVSIRGPQGVVDQAVAREPDGSGLVEADLEAHDRHVLVVAIED